MSKQAKIILFSCFYILGIVATSFENFLVINILVIAISLFLHLKKYFSLRYMIVLTLIYIVGITNTIANTKNFDDLSSFTDNVITIEAKVLNIPSNSNIDKTSFFAKVNAVINDKEEIKNISSKTMVTINDTEDKIRKIKIGDNLKLTGSLKKPQSAKNPAQFDYAKYLQIKKTFSLLYVEDNWEIKGHDKHIGWKLLRKLNDKRNEIINIHSQNIDSPMLEILGGIIFGDDAINPDEETKDNFINSGIVHILAASGMNVTLIFGIWFFFARSLRINHRTSIFTGILLILFYTCMTGFGPPIIRASIMLTLILIGKLIDRKSSTISILFLVGFLMLLYNPLMLFDIGFQLSFIVTFALILTAPLLTFNFKYKLVNYLLCACCVPIIAQLFASPLQLYYFNTFTIYSVFANIAIIPVLSIVSFIGFISSILALIPFWAKEICYFADLILNPLLIYIVKIANFFSDLPYAIIYFKKPLLIQIILYFILLIGFICIIRFKLKNKKIYIALFLLLLIFIASFCPLRKNNTEVIFFSMGNADSILIKSPKNQFFLIDSGRLPYLEQNSQAKNIIINYLYDKGIMNLNSYIITHFDSDHAGGSIDILDNIEVENIYISDISEDTQLSNNILSYFKEKNIKPINIENITDIYEEKDFKLTLIKPFGTEIRTENQKSLIIHCKYKNNNLLFMGDGDSLSYNAIPEVYKENLSYIKIGHHGAKNTLNKEMLSNSEVFIISTGKNPYNHPHYETIELLKNKQKQFFRTDYHNAIKTVLDDKGRKIYLFSPNLKKFIKHN